MSATLVIVLSAAVALIGRSHDIPPAAAVAAQPMRFQVISDPHVSYSKLGAALDDLRAVGPDAQALFVNGDITNYGVQAEYDRFKQTVAARPHAPVHVSIGNHEYFGSDSSAIENERFRRNFGRSSVYFDLSIGGYPFIVLGGENGDGDPPGNLPNIGVLSDAQLDWLQSRLRTVAQPGRPTFVLLHQPPRDTNQQTRLNAILAGFPNVVLFFSHWHGKLSIPNSDLFNRTSGYWQVHTGGIHELQGDWQAMQGLQVEVHAGKVVIRGRDFAARQWIPAFQHEIALTDDPDNNSGSFDFDSDGKDDIVGQWGDGRLTIYTATGDRPAGTGFNYLRRMVLIDLDNDGRKDIFGLWPDGRITAYLNNGNGSLTQREMAGSAWDTVDRLTVVDFDGDGRDDILGRRADGSLSAYLGGGTPGNPRFSAQFDRIDGSLGWGGVNRIRVADLDRDGKPDLFGTWIDGGSMAYLNGSTPGNPRFSAMIRLFDGWQTVDRLTVLDVDRDGWVDLLGRRRDGSLSAYLHAGSPGRPAFTQRDNIFGNWNAITRLTVLDQNGDGVKEMVGRTATGQLITYYVTGSPGNPALSASTPYGSSWQDIVRVPTQ